MCYGDEVMKKKDLVKKILQIYKKELNISWNEEKTHYNRLIKMRYEEVEWIYLETLKIYKIGKR